MRLTGAKYSEKMISDNKVATKTKTMEKHIHLDTDKKEEIATTFKTSYVTVWKALNYKVKSPFSKTLRAAALQRGGLIYTGRIPDGYIPNVDTEFDHNKGIIIQSFGDAAQVRFEKDKTTIEFTGADPVIIGNVTTQQWERLLYGIQMQLNRLYESAE